MTLAELTNGNESGIIVRMDKYAIIYYGACFAEAGDECLPFVDPLSIGIIWMKVNGAFDDAVVEEVENFRSIFNPDDYDPDNKWDHWNRFDETCSEVSGEAVVVTLKDGTMIIAPKDWN